MSHNDCDSLVDMLSEHLPQNVFNILINILLGWKNKETVFTKKICSDT